MTSEEIKKVLDSHQKWINEEDGGERANLRWADLSCANLSGAKLSRTDLREANLRGAHLRNANLRGAHLRNADLGNADLHDADLSNANLWGANLFGADLSDADLRGADLDYSCFPLWCGGSRFKCDTKLVYQLLAHIYTLDFDDPEGIKALIKPFAIKSHRAKDLGLKEESK